jgi:hypothetical protein
MMRGRRGGGVWLISAQRASFLGAWHQINLDQASGV